MRTKLLLIALVLSNAGWALAFHIINDSRKQEIVWLHEAQKQVDFCLVQARQLNDDIGKMCRCNK